MISPAMSPGGKLSRKSITPDANPLRRLSRSCSPVYSRPSMNRSRIPQIWDRAGTNFGGKLRRTSPAVAEGQSGQQVEGNGRKAEAVREPAQNRQAQDDGSQLDEDQMLRDIGGSEHHAADTGQ